MREFPLYQIHPNAMPAANAAECIAAQLGNDGWWKFVDDDFNNQANIGTAFFTAEAQKLGVDMTKYNSCITNSTYLTKIEQSISDAESAGVAHRVLGTTLPVLEVQLQPGQSVISEGGEMSWMTPTVTMTSSSGR